MIAGEGAGGHLVNEQHTGHQLRDPLVDVFVHHLQAPSQSLLLGSRRKASHSRELLHHLRKAIIDLFGYLKSTTS